MTVNPIPLEKWFSVLRYNPASTFSSFFSLYTHCLYTNMQHNVIQPV